MRNILGKLCAILATLVLLFSAAFFTVSLILRDNNAIGTLYKKQEIRQQVEESTGMSRSAEMENAAVALLDYMRGDRANIKVGGSVNGEYRDDLFSQEKEVVHMAEVQQLWLTLDWFAKYGAIGAGVFLLFGFFLMQHGKRRALLSSAILWGSGIFGGILAFMGVWALLNFDSFWTVFHFVIFPKSLFQYLSAGATAEAMNELNWVLDSDSVMVNMLMPIFPSLVLRCAICVILEVAATAIIAVIIHFAWRKQGKPSPVADVVVIEHDANEPIPIKGPDLVLAHKLRNAPKNKREEIIRRAERGEPLDDAPIDYETETTPQSPSDSTSLHSVTEEDRATTQSAVYRVPSTASPQGEAHEGTADQKPSPRGEGGPLAVDEVSIPDVPNEASISDAPAEPVGDVDPDVPEEKA